jgi:hypothetical protein
MSAPKRFRVAIWYVDSYLCRFCSWITSFSGAGIGGLTLALALSRNPDIEIDIYEGATKITEVGAGIGFWARQYLTLDADRHFLTRSI